MADLATAIEHLKAFRDGIHDDGLVDEDSGLTAADLDAVLATIDVLTAAVGQPDLNAGT